MARWVEKVELYREVPEAELDDVLDVPSVIRELLHVLDDVYRLDDCALVEPSKTLNFVVHTGK